jgi:hypothetical protein
MHKNVPVADLEINDINYAFRSIYRVYNKEHLPVGVVKLNGLNGAVDAETFDTWWEMRGIPKQRTGINSALNILSVKNTKILSIKGLGLNLSDHYWFLPKEQKADWNEVNYFDHNFSEDIGNILIGEGQRNIKDIQFSSPDTSSNGNLMKRWWIYEGKRYLLKSGEMPYLQEPFNEVIASRICDLLDIPHVRYDITQSKQKLYSACECFVDRNTELINAWQLLSMLNGNDKNKYANYLKISENLRIEGIKESLDRIMVLDFIIGNTDRHWNNFGAIRDADTLEWIGPAPVYDCGASLWYNVDANMIEPNYKIGSMMFRTNHTRQIKLVTDFTWYKPERLSNIENDIYSIFKKYRYKNEERVEAISKGVRGRIKKLNNIIMDIK